MSGGDGAIALLSEDGGGVIKPIAGDDEQREKPRGNEGGILRACLPAGRLDWRVIAAFSIFRAGGFLLKRRPPTSSIFSPPHLFSGQGQSKDGGVSDG